MPTIQALLKTEKPIFGICLGHQLLSQETGWHRHDVPLYARVLGGELEVDYGGGTVKRYRAGDTFLEAMDRYHNGRVVGGGTVQILVVFMGAEGVSDTEMRK